MSFLFLREAKKLLDLHLPIDEKAERPVTFRRSEVTLRPLGAGTEPFPPPGRTLSAGSFTSRNAV
jgi:hypothetical protein